MGSISQLWNMYDVNIMQLCIHKLEYVNITTPERFMHSV